MDLKIIEVIEVGKMRLDAFRNLNGNHPIEAKAIFDNLNDVVAELERRFYFSRTANGYKRLSAVEMTNIALHRAE